MKSFLNLFLLWGHLASPRFRLRFSNRLSARNGNLLLFLDRVLMVLVPVSQNTNLIIFMLVKIEAIGFAVL